MWARSWWVRPVWGRRAIQAARGPARDFVRGRPHDRIGVVGFAATAFTQCPLTLDHDTLLELLDGRDPSTVVHHCGSGVTAVPNILAMEIAGLGRPALFAGSWSE